MDWLISLKQFEELATAKPSPPYFLLVAGLLITLACAIPLAIVINQRMAYWAKYLSPSALPLGGRLQFILPFSGTAGGLCIFLASSFEVFGLPVLPSLFFALLLTALFSYLAWTQLGKMLSRRVVRSYLEQSADKSLGDDQFRRTLG